MPSYFVANPPQSMNTKFSRPSLSALMAASVKSPHPNRWWLLATWARTVSVAFSKRTPCFSPSRKVAWLWDRSTQIGCNLLIDILQWWRELYPIRHREAQSHCLSRFVIRVLTDYHNPHLIERTEIESIENQSSRRIAGELSVLLFHLFYQLQEIGFLKLSPLIALPMKALSLHP